MFAVLNKVTLTWGGRKIPNAIKLIKNTKKAQSEIRLCLFGAGDVTRTHDLLITNQLHYRLCYTSKFATLILYLYFLLLSRCFFKIVKIVFALGTEV